MKTIKTLCRLTTAIVITLILILVFCSCSATTAPGLHQTNSDYIYIIHTGGGKARVLPSNHTFSDTLKFLGRLHIEKINCNDTTVKPGQIYAVKKEYNYR